MQVTAGRDAEVRPTIAFLEETVDRIRPVDLNTVDLKALKRLPGIGPATAEKIIASRKADPFVHPADLVARNILGHRHLRDIVGAARGTLRPVPEVTAVTADAEPVLYHKPFKLRVAVADSESGIRLARLRVESMSHSLDLAREVTEKERKAGTIIFDLPAMEPGPAEIEVSIYDNDGNKDYHATTVQIFHNPLWVFFWPSERSARLSRGAALLKSDGQFHCNSSFSFYNGTGASSTLNRNMTWRLMSSGGSVLQTGAFDFGSNIVIGAGAWSSGWWFNFWFPPGSAVYNRLRNKEEIRIEWTFTEVGTGALVRGELTWRAVVNVDVNIIRVGEQNFTDAERTRTFNALRSTASSIYQALDLDIGTIGTYVISNAQAGGYITIDSDGEAENLTSDWTVPNQAIDMFVVRNYVGSVAGLSPVNGPCNKDAKGMNGLVVELLSTQAVTGVIMAHEMGHYLGLPHTNSTNNVMNPSVGTGNTVLTNSQGNTMKAFPCFLRFAGS